MAIRPGDLRERIDIQSVAEATVAGGGKSKAWTTFAPGIWASITPLNGGEAFAQGVARSTQFYKVVIRWRGDITPRNRIIWNGQPLNIRTAADPDMRRSSLELRVESGAAEPA